MTDDSSPNELPAVLSEIVEFKHAEVEQQLASEPLTVLESKIADLESPRDFFAALVNPSSTATRVIAEVKRRSPSAGLIRPEYDQDGFLPELIAQEYSQAGASAISCLTDEKFFGGHLSFINRIKSAIPLPVIRKDFIIDPYQIHQARAYGSDAVLLIAECLSSEQIREMLDLAHTLSMSVLLESHSRENLERVLPIASESSNKNVLIGVNNRDLTKMKTDLSHTNTLAELVCDRSTLVSESGIKTPEDLAQLRESNINIVLVGEHLMSHEHPGDALRTLLS